MAIRDRGDQYQKAEKSEAQRVSTNSSVTDWYRPFMQEFVMKKICWGWILLGGFLVELAIFAVAIPLSLLIGQDSLLYIAPRRMLHGAFSVKL